MKNLYLLEQALRFAQEKHKNQKRKGTDLPYFVHIRDVVKILKDNNADKETLIVGALHDTLEDTNTTISEISELFGIDVAYMVDTLTEKKSLPYDERKHLQYLRIKNAERKIKMVKCADCLSNLRDTENEMNTENFWSRFNAPKESIKKHYQESIDALKELDNTKMYKELKQTFNNVFQEKILKKDCTDCNFMKRILTPNPYDWFCDDDEKYVCGISGKTLSEANRPYEKQPVPNDCPLLDR